MQSILLSASAGSGKTTRLTDEVFRRISTRGKFISALTFTRAATAEMRSRIMEAIASRKELPLLTRLNLIMEAGRVGYSTIDSFFYRLYAASGHAPKMADEKTQLELSGAIESLFRDNIMKSGKANKLIIAARILKTDMEALWSPLAEEQTVVRCLADMDRLDDLDALMKENGILVKELESLSKKVTVFSALIPAGNVQRRVIQAMTHYESFITKAVAAHSDLENYKGLGKTIQWDQRPYSELNRIFRDYRKTAEKLAVNKALLRELTVALLCGIYLDAADAVKKKKGVIFFADVRRSLLALDGNESDERPKLMGNYFSLGLDRTGHLLVDEFQDTSKGDIAILLPLVDEILSGHDEGGIRSFFAVGDWKQMIYGWRGANREALEAAIGSYLKNGVIAESSLPYNFRSTPLLISFFNKLVENLFDGKEKTETQKPPEKTSGFAGVTEVNLVKLEKDGNSEASFYPAIIEVLKAKKSEYDCPWGDMAVLAATNNHVQKISSELASQQISVSEVRGRQLLSTEEGVAVMLFIAGVLSKDGDQPFAQIAAQSPLWREIFGNIGEVRAEFARKYPAPFGIMAVSCAIELLRGKLRATILDIWQDETQAFFSEGGVDVDAFLSRMFHIRFNVKAPEAENRDSLKVDTIHGTKGLQFKHVFVFWNEDEKEPPFYLRSEKCHVQFTSGEFTLLGAGESAVAREIIENREENLTRMRREKANVFYVAATRAIQTLTVFLPVKKEENYKAVHQAVLDTFSQFAPEGNKRNICAFSGPSKEAERIAIFDAPEKHEDEPDHYGEIDPTLLSACIKAGIMRGERLHRWLAKVVDRTGLPSAGELNHEEYESVLRFVERSDVADIMFRSGKLYIEQQISDKNDFGIVDRMIVSDQLITIMDYKSGSMRGLKQKYDEQLKRYTRIMETLYPSRKVEYYILPIDI
jgi:ATP-dependent exoDNAse (exonuclease V) beta subunit